MQASLQIVTSQAVKELLTSNPQPAVTIYAPMHTTGSPRHITENQARMKRLISKAIGKVNKQYGENHLLAKDLRDWLNAYYEDLGFWERQTAGLLLCARPNDVRWFNLPADTDEYIAVDETLHLAPILTMMHDNQPYYILLVNQHKPKLFRGDMYGLRMSELELPASVEAALGIDENIQEDDHLKFFRIIDRTVCEKISDKLPLILAGTESETAEYRSHSKYPYILQPSLAGSRVDLDMQAMHSHAVSIIKQELVAPTHRKALEEYYRLAGANPDRTMDTIPAIESAIGEGRVDKLLAPLSTHTADTIHDTLNAMDKISLPQGESGRLLNRLALEVWRMSGTVISLTPQQMPNGAALAARLRY